MDKILFILDCDLLLTDEEIVAKFSNQYGWTKTHSSYVSKVLNKLQPGQMAQFKYDRFLTRSGDRLAYRPKTIQRISDSIEVNNEFINRLRLIGDLRVANAELARVQAMVDNVESNLRKSQGSLQKIANKYGVIDT